MPPRRGIAIGLSAQTSRRGWACRRAHLTRTRGDNMASYIRYCGGIPLVMLASKQKQAIEDGTIDMTISGITTVKTRELSKSTDTITRTEHAAFEFIVIINDKVWQSHTREHQAIVTAAARRAEGHLRRKTADIEAEAYAFPHEGGELTRTMWRTGGPAAPASWRTT